MVTLYRNQCIFFTNLHFGTEDSCQWKCYLVTNASIRASTDPCYGCTHTRLKPCMFFAAVGSTIRRCTKLYALSHLPWALGRTAPTGWHARFGSPVLTTHLALFPVGFFLTSSHPHPHPLPHPPPLPPLPPAGTTLLDLQGCAAQVKE